jgi:hypothetical protein
MTSTTNREKDAPLGYLFLRVTIGTNILIHGLSRILAGPSHFAYALVAAFQRTPLPSRSVHLLHRLYPRRERPRLTNAGWDQNANCTLNRIRSHLGADFRRNAKPRLGKR